MGNPLSVASVAFGEPERYRRVGFALRVARGTQIATTTERRLSDCYAPSRHDGQLIATLATTHAARPDVVCDRENQPHASQRSLDQGTRGLAQIACLTCRDEVLFARLATRRGGHDMAEVEGCAISGGAAAVLTAEAVPLEHAEPQPRRHGLLGGWDAHPATTGGWSLRM
jgi:hypothetical protein